MMRLMLRFGGLPRMSKCKWLCAILKRGSREGANARRQREGTEGKDAIRNGQRTIFLWSLELLDLEPGQAPRERVEDMGKMPMLRGRWFFLGGLRFGGDGVGDGGGRAAR